MTWNQELKLKQVDSQLSNIRLATLPNRPKSGWLKLIRTTLAMSARALGTRVGLAQSRIALIEKGEIEGTITLNTLKKVADGLECDFVYFLMPRDGSLSRLREKQAYKKAAALDAYAELHMTLEGQSTSSSYQNASIEKLKEEYLKTWPRDFWEKL